MESKQIDLSVEITLCLTPTEEGGRKGPIYWRYRPDWHMGRIPHFPRDRALLWAGEMTLAGTEFLAPGECGAARILPFSPEYWHPLRVGDQMEMCEGPRVVGLATITAITVIDDAEAAREATAARVPAASAHAINNRGQIVGQSTNAEGREHAVLWQEGQITDLGTLPGHTWSSASAINDCGQIIGSSTERTPLGGDRHAVLWQNGEVVDLGTLPGHLYGRAQRINNRGQIVGVSQDERVLIDVNAVLSGDRGIIELDGLPDAHSTYAAGINDKGHVVGRSGNRCVLWQDGKITELEVLPGCEWGVTRAINNRGQIIGNCRPTIGDWHAVLWQDGEVIELDALPGHRTCEPKAINDRGQIVGHSDCDYRPGAPGERGQSGFRHAVLWQDREVVDLGTLPGVLHSDALALNDAGQIVGTSETFDEKTHAVLWEDGRIIDLGSLTEPGHRVKGGG